MKIHSVILNHLVQFWMIHTVPVAISSLVILGSCAHDIDGISFLTWLHFPAYLMHQCEEYIFPGGFKHHFNMTVGKMVSGGFEALLSDGEICIINVVVVWGVLSVCAVATQHYTVALSVVPPIFVLSNALLHIATVIRKQCYSPGFFTSAALFVPLGTYTLYVLHLRSRLSIAGLMSAIVFSLVAHGGIVALIFFKAGLIKKRTR